MLNPPDNSPSSESCQVSQTSTAEEREYTSARTNMLARFSHTMQLLSKNSVTTSTQTFDASTTSPSNRPKQLSEQIIGIKRDLRETDIIDSGPAPKQQRTSYIEVRETEQRHVAYALPTLEPDFQNTLLDYPRLALWRERRVPSLSQISSWAPHTFRPTSVSQNIQATEIQADKTNSLR